MPKIKPAPVSEQRVKYDQSVRNICEHLGIADRTLREWIAQGRVPYRVVGGRMLRFNLDEVEAALLSERR